MGTETFDVYQATSDIDHFLLPLKFRNPIPGRVISNMQVTSRSQPFVGCNLSPIFSANSSGSCKLDSCCSFAAIILNLLSMRLCVCPTTHAPSDTPATLLVWTSHDLSGRTNTPECKTQDLMSFKLRACGYVAKPNFPATAH